MKYSTATEQSFSTCLPPEDYIKICKTVKECNQPRFASSLYPAKQTIKPKKKILKKICKYTICYQIHLHKE